MRLSGPFASPPPADDGMECPMCGGVGRIFNITAALTSAIEAGSAVVVPMGSKPDGWTENLHCGCVVDEYQTLVTCEAHT